MCSDPQCAKDDPFWKEQRRLRQEREKQILIDERIKRFISPERLRLIQKDAES